MAIHKTESYECDRCGIQVATTVEAMSDHYHNIESRTAPRSLPGQPLEDLDPVHARVLAKAHAIVVGTLENVGFGTLLLCDDCGRAFVSWLAREPEETTP